MNLPRPPSEAVTPSSPTAERRRRLPGCSWLVVLSVLGLAVWAIVRGAG